MTTLQMGAITNVQVRLVPLVDLLLQGRRHRDQPQGVESRGRGQADGSGRRRSQNSERQQGHLEEGGAQVSEEVFAADSGTEKRRYSGQTTSESWTTSRPKQTCTIFLIGVVL